MSLNITNEELQNLIDEDPEVLYSRLGQVIPSGAVPLSPREYAAYGREWFNQQRESLQKLVCKNEVITLLNGGEFDLFLAIATVLVQRYGAEYSVTIAALILKVGINQFCNLQQQKLVEENERNDDE